MYDKKNKKKNRKYRDLKKLRSRKNNIISPSQSLNNINIISNAKIRDKIKEIKYTLDIYIDNIDKIQNKYWIYNIFMINYKKFFLYLKFIFLKKYYLFGYNKNEMKYYLYPEFDNKKKHYNNYFYEKDRDKLYLRSYCKNHISKSYNSLFDQIKYRIKIGFYSNNQLENEILKYFNNKIINKKYHNQIEWLIT